MNQIIVNVVGHAGSGKSSVCDYLVKKYDFTLWRPSDVIREYARSHDIELNNRQDYIDIHKEIIQDDWLGMIRPALESTVPRLCMDGFRAPAPFEHLRKEKGAVTIYLDCPIEARFTHIQADATRKGHRVQPSLSEFEADEKPDYTNDDSNLPNMTEMKRLADYIVDANRPFEAILKDMDDIIARLTAPTD